jgi:hypothetical protein
VKRTFAGTKKNEKIFLGNRKKKLLGVSWKAKVQERVEKKFFFSNLNLILNLGKRALLCT